MDAYQPNAFWYSRLQDYHTCPKLYEMKHLQGVKVDEKSIDLEYGTALHMGVNEILEQGGDGVETFRLYWNSLNPEAYPKSRFSHETLLMNGEVHLSRFARMHAKKFKPFKMEERIHVTIDGVDLEGTPDFIGDFEEEPSIVDFKTTASNYVPEKIISGEQLPFYGALARAKYDYVAKKRTYFIFKKDQKEPSIQKALKADLTRDVELCIMNNVKATVAEIKRCETFVRNTNNCVRGTLICPYFQECWGKKEKSNG